MLEISASRLQCNDGGWEAKSCIFSMSGPFPAKQCEVVVEGIGNKAGKMKKIMQSCELIGICGDNCGCKWCV